MPIIDNKKWADVVQLNDDPYSKCCVDVAAEVMRLLDLPEHAEFDCHAIINKADDDTKAGGLTGYMAGAVASMVAQCHSRGEEFKLQWNRGYGVDDATVGTVNPALVTIDTSKL